MFVEQRFGEDAFVKTFTRKKLFKIKTFKALSYLKTLKYIYIQNRVVMI